jgi:hypothetical protein
MGKNGGKNGRNRNKNNNQGGQGFRTHTQTHLQRLGIAFLFTPADTVNVGNGAHDHFFVYHIVLWLRTMVLSLLFNVQEVVLPFLVILDTRVSKIRADMNGIVNSQLVSLRQKMDGVMNAQLQQREDIAQLRDELTRVTAKNQNLSSDVASMENVAKGHTAAVKVLMAAHCAHLATQRRAAQGEGEK